MKKKKTAKKLKKKIAVLETENQSLQESVLRAENNSREKSAFLSHMSHDIRTPLNGIIGMTNIALKHFDDKDRFLDCLEKIDSSSKHLVSLINDILDMSRIESGRMVMNHEQMDIREVINSCAFIAESLLAQRKVDFVREFGIFHHPLLIGDELHLRQILIIRALPRADAATVPIVAMTADAYDEDVRKTAVAGMNAHLTKPVSQEKLLLTLGEFYSV